MNQPIPTRPPLLLLLAGLWFAGSACVNTSYDQRARQTARVHADQQWIEEQIQRVQGRQENTDLQIEELHRQIDRLREEIRRAGSMQESAVTLKVDAVEARIAQLEAARQRDREEIVNHISERMSRMIAASAPTVPTSRPSRPVSATGYEHIVEAGQTLSHIAQAYGVTVRAIVDANNIPDPNNLRVGQKLFIPD